MHIKINEDYNVVVNTALLGYVGETNARPVSVEGMEIDGADRYVLTIDYGDGTVYEVDITGGQWTPTADILRSAQTVSCQICAKKLSGDEYILVKKSRIFRLRIGAAIGDNAVPSPSVATDALDRIDAIGKQAHADMQKAVTAAETATTAAENAKKSVTNAGLSADTATQAAERAETAKTAAETSATQAETARQGAETARAEAVTSQNNAKISAAQASASAQQTTADKNITAGYAKTAKTNADSTAADRQAVQTLAEQVTADKTTVADHAAKVATDRKAAETAAQTAQSIADSLPDDYVTAVGKIAENAAEISAAKLTDKELQRRVNALFDMGQGVTHQFETDTNTAYQKTVPTGAKLMSVKSVGGRSIVFNQLADVTDIVDEAFDNYYKETLFNGNRPKWTKGHKYLFALYVKSSAEPFGISIGYSDSDKVPYDNDGKTFSYKSSGKELLLFTPDDSLIDSGYQYIALRPVRYDTQTRCTISVRNLMIFDLTVMFGSGNEPASVEEFEAMFPNDYYPYNAGEVVSAGVTDVTVGDTARQIPEAIRNLPGYGWSAGTAKNYVDYENKRYVQCVGSVDLGTLDWELNMTSAVGNHFYAPAKHLNFKYLGAFGTTIYNALCSKYRTVARSSNVFVDKTLTIDGVTVVSQIQVKDTAYTDATAFKQAMSGVMLYYELANPIVTDISTLIDDDFLRNLTVEAGGSVTFKGGNDDYRIPVPSEEEYIVKLSEIGGTT